MPMTRRNRLLVITFLSSFSMVLMERGLYFYTHEVLGFSEAMNLWMALGFGLAYIGGALASHRLAHWLGERRTLSAAMVCLLVVHASLTIWPDAWLLLSGVMLIAGCYGLIWPIVESYLSAGLGPRDTMKLLGRFNITWASSVPLAIAISGPVIESSAPWLLFAGAGVLNLAALALVRRLVARPVHLPMDHPERPPAARLARYRAMLVSSRWGLFASNALLLLMSPLLPQIFEDLGLSVSQATWGTSLMDLTRFTAFVVLGYSAFWYGRGASLFVMTLALPLGFLLVLFGGNLWLVLAGEVVYGLAAGLAYYAALYYAMVVKNASVDAGGAHEALIGVGFALGPAVGLMGLGLGDAAGGRLPGMLLGLVPLLLIGTLAGLWPLRRLKAVPATEAPVTEPMLG